MSLLQTQAERLVRGSAALARRYGRWLLPGRVRPACARLLGSAGGAWIGAHVLLGAPGAAWPLTGWWCIAAWRTGRAIQRREEAGAAFVQLLANLIGPGSGVLLADVAAALQTADPRIDTAAVRAQCAAVGVPVRDAVRVGGRVSVGVHGDDLRDVWDVHASPPPAPSREWHPSVTRDNYTTTPEGQPLSEGDVDQGPAGVDPLDPHFADVLDAITGPPAPAPRKTA